MVVRKPKYSMEDHHRMATELYEQKIRSQVEAGNHGMIVAIDVDSGDYQVGDNTMTAGDPLLERQPDAQIWCFRIGFPYVDRIGGFTLGGL